MRLACLIAFAFLPCLAADAGTVRREWFTLELEGQRAGYASRESEATTTGSIEREHLVMDLVQASNRARVEQTIEVERDADDRTVALGLDAVAGTAHTRWTATVVGDALHIVSEAAGTIAVPFDTTAILPQREPALIGALRNSATPLEYRLFDPVLIEIVAVRAERVPDDVAAAKGEVRVRTTRHVHGADRFQDYWLGADGSVERIQAQFIGLALVWTPCAVDCDRPVEPPFDPLARMAVRAPVRIPTRVYQGRIRYVIARDDGGKPKLIGTAEQTVAYDGARAIVTVCAECDARDWPDKAELARYLAPNAWVQSDAAEIRALARRSAPRHVAVARRMKLFAQAVRAHMSGPVDFLGYADALQALRGGSGDCTEFAVLLAALGRAGGIPTRVVFGLAYADRFSGRTDVFSPHAWVQAWDGRRWSSFDAALGTFDATHIALAVGTGDPNEIDADFRQVRALRIEKASWVRR